MFEPIHERIPSGEWSAAAVAQNDTLLYADIEDFFASLDYQDLFNTVLDHRQVDLPVAIQALDDVLGEIPVASPFTDEDGEL